MKEIFFLFKWGDGGGKKINESFCFAARTQLAGLSGMSSVADDSVVCPHMMQCTASPPFFELGISW